MPKLVAKKLTPKQQEQNYLTGLLYEALGSQYGLELVTNDPHKCRMRLYEARRAAGDPALERLQFRLAPWDHRAICIVKGAEKQQGDQNE